MKKLTTVLGYCLVVALMSTPFSCYYNSEEELYGGGGGGSCDTTGIRYSVEIKQILNTYCNTCHLGAVTSQIPYLTYAQLKATAVNGTLLDRINNESLPMPETGLMDTCNRRKIEAWVKAGAPNN